MELSRYIKKHVSYLAADEVFEICRPLFNAFNLNYFDYAKVYPDGSCLHLTSHREGYYNYLCNKYPLGANVSSGIHLWSSYMPKKAIIENRNYFNLTNGATFCKKMKDYIEYFDLAAPRNNHAVFDFYLNQADVLTQFIFYFKEKARNLISQAYSERFLLSDSMFDSSRKDIFDKKFQTDFINLINIKKIYLNSDSNEFFLSKREYDVLLQSSIGKTAKEVAQILHISHRTVESCLASAKNKSNCHSRSELITVLKNNIIN